MNGLSLLPLETHVLPGWPPVEDPGAGLFWIVLVVIPVSIGLILALLNAAPELIRKNRADVMGVAPDEDAPGPDTDVAPAISGRTVPALAPVGAVGTEAGAESAGEHTAEAEAQPTR